MPPQHIGEVRGTIASLHLHPTDPGKPLTATDCIEVVSQKGIVGEPRCFGRASQSTGEPSRRQVTLIEREQIAGHAAALCLQSIPPGAVRSNIETQGINLIELIGKQIEIGDAILLVYEARLPCAKMDAVCMGLRSLMENTRQGVLAEVLKSGHIRVNDPVRIAKTPVRVATDGISS